MSTQKYFNVIAVGGMVVAVILTIFLNLGASGNANQTGVVMGYEEKIFDTSMVHTIDIQIDDWEAFLETAVEENYSPCTLIIDGETYANVGIRGKGNTSLTSVQKIGNDRYSFKVEFDQYQDGNTYYGLDKLCLNNLYADNTYMKDYLTYTMMQEMGVASPLCSYVYLTVNGEDWGLYLAAEGVEESFLQRNYGKDYGELYKPDTVEMGGGVGHGKDFDGEQIPQMPDRAEMLDMSGEEAFNPGELTERGERPMGESLDGIQPMEGQNRGGSGMGSGDVKLQYIDDDADSYSNIFDNAKTGITQEDKQRLIQSLENLTNQENLEETVDREAVIKYLVVHNFVCNGDSYTGSMVHNYYLYEKNGQLSMIPWDYNLAFGGFSQMGGGRNFSPTEGEAETGQPDSLTQGEPAADGILSQAASEVNSPIDSPVSGGDITDRPMVAWIFDGGEYQELYHNYYTLFIKENFSDNALEKEILRVQQMIAPYVKKDPTAFCSYEEFEAGTEALKEFLTLRAESVIGQLSGTIPSTSEGQAQDTSALIQAGDLDLTLMGQMDMGGGQSRPDFGEGRTFEELEIPEEMKSPEGEERPQGLTELPQAETKPKE